MPQFRGRNLWKQLESDIILSRRSSQWVGCCTVVLGSTEYGIVGAILNMALLVPYFWNYSIKKLLTKYCLVQNIFRFLRVHIVLKESHIPWEKCLTLLWQSCFKCLKFTGLFWLKCLQEDLKLCVELMSWSLYRLHPFFL